MTVECEDRILLIVTVFSKQIVFVLEAVIVCVVYSCVPYILVDTVYRVLSQTGANAAYRACVGHSSYLS